MNAFHQYASKLLDADYEPTYHQMKDVIMLYEANILGMKRADHKVASALNGINGWRNLNNKKPITAVQTHSV